MDIMRNEITIVVDDDLIFGKPSLNGSRFPVANMINLICSNNFTLEEAIENYGNGWVEEEAITVVWRLTQDIRTHLSKAGKERNELEIEILKAKRRLKKNE